MARDLCRHWALGCLLAWIVLPPSLAPAQSPSQLDLAREAFERHDLLAALAALDEIRNDPAGPASTFEARLLRAEILYPLIVVMLEAEEEVTTLLPELRGALTPETLPEHRAKVLLLAGELGVRLAQVLYFQAVEADDWADFLSEEFQRTPGAEADIAQSRSKATDLRAELRPILDEGVSWLDSARQANSSAEDPDPEVEARVLCFLGVAAAVRGEADEARRLTDQAVELLENAFGKEDPRLAWLLGQRLVVRSSQVSEAELLPDAVRACHLAHRRLGILHPMTTDTCAAAANMSAVVGEIEGAHRYSETALTLPRQLDDPEVLWRKYHDAALTFIESASGLEIGVEYLYQAAKTWIRTSQAQESVDVAETMRHLFLGYLLDEPVARKQFTERLLLDPEDRLIDEAHPAFPHLLDILADAREATGEEDAARQLRQQRWQLSQALPAEVQALLARSRDEPTPDMADELKSLALTMALRGAAHAVWLLHAREAELREELLGLDHKDTYLAHHLTAVTLVQLGRPGPAEDEYLDYIERLLALESRDRNATSIALGFFADFYDELGEPVEAEIWRQRADTERHFTQAPPANPESKLAVGAATDNEAPSREQHVPSWSSTPEAPTFAAQLWQRPRLVAERERLRGLELDADEELMETIQTAEGGNFEDVQDLVFELDLGLNKVEGQAQRRALWVAISGRRQLWLRNSLTEARMLIQLMQGYVADERFDLASDLMALAIHGLLDEMEATGAAPGGEEAARGWLGRWSHLWILTADMASSDRQLAADALDLADRLAAAGLLDSALELIDVATRHHPPTETPASKLDVDLDLRLQTRSALRRAEENAASWAARVTEAEAANEQRSSNETLWHLADAYSEWFDALVDAHDFEAAADVALQAAHVPTVTLETVNGQVIYHNLVTYVGTLRFRCGSGDTPAFDLLPRRQCLRALHRLAAAQVNAAAKALTEELDQLTQAEARAAHRQRFRDAVLDYLDVESTTLPALDQIPDLGLRMAEVVKAGVAAEALRQPSGPSDDVGRLSDLASLQARLAPDEAVLSYFVGTDTSYLWLLRHDRLHRFELPLEEPRLRNDITLLRAALVPSANADIPLELGQRLYRQLVGVAEQALQDIDLVYLVPDGALQTLPFASLVAGDDSQARRWWIEDVALTTLPSLDTLSPARAATDTGDLRDFVGFGDPVGRDGGPPNPFERLPESADELRDIAEALGVQDSTGVQDGTGVQDSTGNLWLGPHMTEANLRRLDLRATRVLAFATHGSMTPEPGLLMTPSAQDDGRLIASEILELDLDADLVLLSACRTATAASGSRDRILSGLPRAFFQAGARAVLATHTQVDSNSAAALTVDMMSRDTRSLGWARGLQRAQVSMALGQLDDQPDDQSGRRTHPAHWASFFLVGAGGRPAATDSPDPLSQLCPQIGKLFAQHAGTYQSLRGPSLRGDRWAVNYQLTGLPTCEIVLFMEEAVMTCRSQRFASPEAASELFHELVPRLTDCLVSDDVEQDDTILEIWTDELILTLEVEETDDLEAYEVNLELRSTEIDGDNPEFQPPR